MAGKKKASSQEAYCVKCKAKRMMVKPHMEKTKNGRSIQKGHCKVCGTKMCKFVKSS